MAAPNTIVKRSELGERGEELLRKREEELPPPGYRRAEVVAQQADELAQKADELNSDPYRMNVDDEALVRELEKLREDRRRPRELTGARADRMYCWVPEKINGKAEFGMIAHCKRNGYDFIERDDPEAPEFRDPDGKRRWNGEILMWCSRRRWEAIVAETKRAGIQKRERDLSLDGPREEGLMLGMMSPERIQMLRGAAAARRLDTRLRQGGDSR